MLRDLAPRGILRAAINYGNPVLAQQGEDGTPRGVSADLARELGSRLGVSVEFVTYDSAGKVFAAIERQAWDVAFLAIDPVRAAQILFTPPYVIIEGTYLVRSDAPFQAIEDLDRAGVRIAVGKGAAYDLFLTRALRHAELVRADTSAGAIELFEAQGLEAAAGVRQPLEEAARARSGLRVIPGRFTAIEQAMGTPIGREAGRDYLAGFLAEMKSGGFVADALRKSGQKGASVAP